MKKYVNISSFNINQPNRGNSALCYGSVAFLLERKLLFPGQIIINFQFYRNPFKAKFLFTHRKNLKIDGQEWTHIIFPVNGIERWLLIKFGILLPFTKFRYYVKNLAYEAAVYGGDGFSDIYGDSIFISRLSQTLPLMRANIPLYILPQTIGPFKSEESRRLAMIVLRYATKIYVRDSNFIDVLNNIKLRYEVTKDLSFFMNPEEFDISIPIKTIGINVSGLAYSNKFIGLEGRFNAYPVLIHKLIQHYQELGFSVFLIPHSYQYKKPEHNNDDYVACKDVYDKLQNKEGVTFVDMNLTSPQVKFVISKMKYFIGTRMHANFAAIYTRVPVFGLAYSYKFEGAFNTNGIDGSSHTHMILDMKTEEIPLLIKKIDMAFCID